MNACEETLLAELTYIGNQLMLDIDGIQGLPELIKILSSADSVSIFQEGENFTMYFTFLLYDKVKIKDMSDRIEEIEKKLKQCFQSMKTQIFLDGNKRASVIFANHYLISHGGGFLVIPEKEVAEFKQLLVKYYEDEDIAVIAAFMKERCWKTIGN